MQLIPKEKGKVAQGHQIKTAKNLIPIFLLLLQKKKKKEEKVQLKSVNACNIRKVMSYGILSFVVTNILPLVEILC